MFDIPAAPRSCIQTLVARRLCPLSQNIGSADILIPFLKIDFPLSWLRLICFSYSCDQENNVIRVQVKTGTLWIFGSSPLPRTDILRPSLRQMAAGIRSQIFATEQIIIPDISIQPLVHASPLASKSIQANLDPTSHSLFSSGLFLSKPPGSLLVKISSNNLQCVAHAHNIKTPSCNDI